MKHRLYAVLSALLVTLAFSGITRAQDQTTPLPDGSVTLETLGLNSYTIQGFFGEIFIAIPVGYDWIFENDIPVTMQYQASPVLNPDQTLASILVKGNPITSFRPIVDGEVHEITFSIPAEYLEPGQNFTIQVQGTLFITQPDCQNDANTGQWLRILNTSVVGLTHAINPLPPVLSDLPGAIVNPVLYEQTPVLFVLPEQANGAALTTAGQVAARLYKQSNITFTPIQVTTAFALTEEQKASSNLVIIGTPEQQPILQEFTLPAALEAGAFKTLDQLAAPPGHGVVQIVPSPWNVARKVLIVSGGNDAGLKLAGQAFADSATFKAMSDRFYFVRGLEPKSTETVPPWTSEVTTLSQLGFFDRTFNGVQTVDSYYNIRRPPGWLFQTGSSLTLKIGFTPMALGSNIIVSLDDVYVGTIDTSDRADQTEVTLQLPVEDLNNAVLERGGINMVLKLTVSNLLPIEQCQDYDARTASTEVSAESYFTVQHDLIPLPDLKAFPYPFISDEPRTPTLIIVPNEPTVDEMAKAINIAGMLGDYAYTDFTLQIALATEVSPDTDGNANLIVLGLSDRQPLIYQVIADSSAVGSNIYQSADSTQDGVLQEGVSAWNADRTVLNVFSKTQAGLDSAVTALLGELPFVSESGSIALAPAGQAVRVVYR